MKGGKTCYLVQQNESENHLEVGGCDTVKLAQNSGRRYLFYDVAHIRAQARGFKQTLNQLGIKIKWFMQVKHLVV